MTLIEPLAIRPVDAARMIGVGLTKFYELIKAGEIRAFKLGRAILVWVETALRAAIGEEKNNG